MVKLVFISTDSSHCSTYCFASSALQCMQVFARDGFIDRHSGRRLIFPGTLRLVSMLFPETFPFQTNWKADACHFAFYELFPTIDHLIPVSRGGADSDNNRVSTSMVRNAAKANFTIQELGWRMRSTLRRIWFDQPFDSISQNASLL